MNFIKIKYAVNTATRNVSDAINTFNKKTKIIQEGVVENTDGVISTILDKVAENYKLNSIKLIPTGFGTGEELGTFFYGVPRFIAGEIPTDSSGKQLRFMAQINCSELVSLQEYPHKGLLQFWVQGDEYRMFLDIKDPKAYQVIYIDNPTTNNIDNVELDDSLYSTRDAADFPFIADKNYNLTDNLLFKLEPEVMTPNRSDIHVLWNLINTEYTNLTGETMSKEVISTVKDAVFGDPRFKSPFGDRVGGYPSFTQDGPEGRNYKDKILLLQLDSNKFVSWGDTGIANFFINPKDLENCNFNDIDFYWDCY